MLGPRAGTRSRPSIFQLNHSLSGGTTAVLPAANQGSRSPLLPAGIVVARPSPAGVAWRDARSRRARQVPVVGQGPSRANAGPARARGLVARDAGGRVGRRPRSAG